MQRRQAALAMCKARCAGFPKAGLDATDALPKLPAVLVLPASFTRLLPGNFGVTLNNDRDCIEVILMRNPSVEGRD